MTRFADDDDSDHDDVSGVAELSELSDSEGSSLLRDRSESSVFLDPGDEPLLSAVDESDFESEPVPAPPAGPANRRGSENPPRRRSRVLGRASSYGDEPIDDLPENDSDSESLEDVAFVADSDRRDSAPTASPSRRRTTGLASDAAGDMTGDEVVAHYAECIRLASQSKINAKNAFHLRLIDIMAWVLRQQDALDGGANKFQHASCALDASAKIYGIRVDTVHSDTLKTAGTMHRLDPDVSAVRDEQVDEEGNVVQPDNPGRKSRRRKMASTIEKVKENLLISERDLVDSVPSHGRVQIDEGRIGVGVFIAKSKLAGDSLALQLSESSKYVFSRFATESEKRKREEVAEKLEEEGWKLDVDSVMETVGDRLDDAILNVPELDYFNFDQDGNGSDMSTDDCDEDYPPPFDEYRYDMNKPMEPPVDMDDGAPEPDDMNLSEPFERSDDEAVPVQAEAEFTFGQDPFADDLDVADDRVIMNLQPSDYSYFDKQLVRIWSGVDRWKNLLKQKGRAPCPRLGAGEEPPRKKRTKTKQTFVIPDWDFSKSEAENFEDIADAFTESSGRAPDVSDRAIAGWQADRFVLPEDHRVEARKLLSYFDLERDVRDVDAPPRPSDENDFDEDYFGYEDPALPQDEGADDPFGAYSGDLGGAQNDFDGGDDGRDSDGVTQALAVAHQAAFVGDNLIEAPLKIPDLTIDYAKAAKRVDMRKLKGTIWALLTREESERVLAEYENQTAEESDAGSSSDEGPKIGDSMGASVVKFSFLYEELRSNLPKKMAEDLTVHLAFAALLHIVNEKGLLVQQDEDDVDDDEFKDFTIRSLLG